MKHQRPRVTVADVERIAAMSDAAFRNLYITQCYHELSAELAERLGGTVTWCTFATWASKQAGRTIRGEDLARVIERELHVAPEVSAAVEAIALAVKAAGGSASIAEVRALAGDWIDPEAAARRASEAVARGNLKVFSEIAREFARFHTRCLDHVEHENDEIAALLEGLRSGEPPDGQDHLRTAFRCYYRAFFERDADARAEWILYGTLSIGFHEQTRLQPEIVAALEAPLGDPDALAARLESHLLRARGWFARTMAALRRWFAGPTPVQLAARAWSDVVRRRLRRIVTEHVMSIDVPPGVTLRLGADLPVSFPASLAALRNTDLIAMLARVDPTRDSPRDSGAADWGDFPERMHFIAELFRCYQETGALLDPPFDAAQVTALRAGDRPSGRL